MPTIKEIIKQEMIEKKQIKKQEEKKSRFLDLIEFSATPEFDFSYRFRTRYENKIMKKLQSLNDDLLIEEIRIIINKLLQTNSFALTSKPYRDFLELF
jgi:hypothetical protein